MDVGLDPRPGRRAAPSLVQDDDGVHGAFKRQGAGFPFTLPGLPVAEGEQRALDVDAEQAGGSGPQLQAVHVAPVCIRHQGAADLEIDGCDADGAVHRVDRQVDREGTTKSLTVRILPATQSSVQSSSTVPGRTLWTCAAPPNVSANSAGPG